MLANMLANPNIRAAIRDGLESAAKASLIAPVLVLAHIGAQHQWTWVREHAGGTYDPIWTAITIGVVAIALGVADAADTYIRLPGDAGVIATNLMEADTQCPGCLRQDMPLRQVICDDCEDTLERGEYLDGYSSDKTDNELSQSNQ